MAVRRPGEAGGHGGAQVGGAGGRARAPQGRGAGGRGEVDLLVVGRRCNSERSFTGRV